LFAFSRKSVSAGTISMHVQQVLSLPLF